VYKWQLIDYPAPSYKRSSHPSTADSVYSHRFFLTALHLLSQLMPRWFGYANGKTGQLIRAAATGLLNLSMQQTEPQLGWRDAGVVGENMTTHARKRSA
jgi:hypothetical protein